MGNGQLVAQSANQIRNVDSVAKKSDLEFINKTFCVDKTVEHLHTMMTEVTKKEFNAQNVNAACHCVSQMNATINTVINAARFIRE